MPEIVVSDDAPDSMIHAHLASKMMFHDAPELESICFVRTFLALDGAVRSAADDASFTLPAWMVRTLLAGASISELEAASQLSKRAGYTAAHMLVTMQIAESLGKPLSLKRAHRVLERAKMADAELVHGVPMFTDWPAARAAWERMRPVAHIWAASALVQDHLASNGTRVEAKHVHMTMALASSLLRWASNARMYRSFTVLDPVSAWALPDRYANPEQWFPPPADYMPKWLVNAIQNYSSQ
jgi:hypothetical protein